MTAGRPAASLGELAVRAHLLDAPHLERLLGELRDRVRAGRATSLARLLVEKGIDGAKVRAAASSVVGVGVRCDACNTTYDANPAVVGREFPCTRCHALIVGLGNLALSGEGMRPIVANEGARPAPLIQGGALRFPEAVPAAMPRTPSVPIIPADTENNIGETTLGFVGVLPIPRQPGPPATPPAPLPPPEDDPGGRTMMFETVLPIPPPRPGAAPAGVLPTPPRPGAPAPAMPGPPPGFAPDSPTFAAPGPQGTNPAASFAPDAPTFAPQVAYPPSASFAPNPAFGGVPPFAPFGGAAPVGPFATHLPAPPDALDTEGVTLMNAGTLQPRAGLPPLPVPPPQFPLSAPAPGPAASFPPSTPAADPFHGSLAETKSDPDRKPDFAATQDAPPPPGAVTGSESSSQKKSLVRRRSYGDAHAAPGKSISPVVIVLGFVALLGVGVAGLAGLYFMGALGGDTKKDEPKKDEPKKAESSPEPGK